MKTINRLASFIKADHRYVYLGTSVIAALGLAFSQRNPTPLSFLAPTGIFQDCLWAILWAWIVVSAAALVTKLMHWSDYRVKSPFASERFRRGARLFFVLYKTERERIGFHVAARKKRFFRRSKILRAKRDHKIRAVRLRRENFFQRALAFARFGKMRV